MNFEEELSKGNFLVPECTTCKKIVWPPNVICNACFGHTMLKPGPKKGKIIEFSKTEEMYFCIVEFANEMRLICNLISNKPPKIGDNVSLVSCGLINDNYLFEVTLD